MTRASDASPAARGGPGITGLIAGLAKENPPWGHRRNHGELMKPGVTVAQSTVWEILRTAGIDPAPRRSGPTWRQFLHAQAAGIVAVDFLHVDTVLLRSLHVLVFIEPGWAAWSTNTRMPPDTGKTRSSPTEPYFRAGQGSASALRYKPAAWRSRGSSSLSGIDGPSPVRYIGGGGHYPDAAAGTRCCSHRNGCVRGGLRKEPLFARKALPRDGP